MITRLFSAALRGVDAQEVEVEVNARGADKPVVIIVGLPDAAVRESSQRVISAIGASALYLDDGIKTVNLAPADLKKEGPSFDLPKRPCRHRSSGANRSRWLRVSHRLDSLRCGRHT